MATREKISLGTTGNDGTGEWLRPAGRKINDNFAKVWAKLGGDSDVMAARVSFVDTGLSFEGTTNDAFETVLTVVDPTADNTITLPDASGIVLLDSAADVVANKTITTSKYVDPIVQDSEGSPYGYVLKPPSVAGNRNVNLPLLADSDTFVFAETIQTLRNKSLDSATINNPILVGMVEDENGANLENITATASAVNYFTRANAATGGKPTLGAAGTDSDVTMSLTGQNSGGVQVNKMVLKSTEVTANGNVPNSVSFVPCNKGSALALTLEDGQVLGEMKVFLNKGAGVATITPTNFSQGTSVAIKQNAACTMIWDNTNWNVISVGVVDSADVVIS
jgi:hypothetical protein